MNSWGETRKRVYEFVKTQLLAGNPPTIREVQTALGFRAVETAREHLERLVQDGLLKKTGKARGYRLPHHFADASQIRLIPLIGRVEAGNLTTAVEDWEDAVPVGIVGGEVTDLFALYVRGESMTGAGILSGDLLIVRRQPMAQDGDIVVALVDDEATVKRLRIDHHRAELHPENPNFDIIDLKRKQGRIFGKVIEVRRRL